MQRGENQQGKRWTRGYVCSLLCEAPFAILAALVLILVGNRDFELKGSSKRGN